MKRIAVNIGVLIGLTFIALQFYQPERNADAGFPNKESFFTIEKTPKNIANILQNSCTNCHSNNTEYPLYSYVQPIRYFLDEHIKEGKENLNFDEWGNYSQRKRNNKLESTINQIEKNEMPLPSYTIIHRNAMLNESQKRKIINYFKNLKQ